MNPRYVIVPTAIGAFGVAWSAAGIARTWMRDRTIEGTRRQILRSFPGAMESVPPEPIAAAMAEVADMLDGRARQPSDGTKFREPTIAIGTAALAKVQRLDDRRACRGLSRGPGR